MIAPTILPSGTTSLGKKWFSCLTNHFLSEVIYKDTLCSIQIIFILLKSSQSVDLESEIAFFNLGLQAQNYS
jgi:hypothetical protein